MNLPGYRTPSHPSQEVLSAELAGIVGRFAPIDGEHATAIPSLTFHRYSAPSREESAFTKVALIFAAQGAKTVTAGNASYNYDTKHCLVTSIDMPVIGRVTQASPEKPYLCFAFEIDMQQVADIVASRELPPPDEAPIDVGISLSKLPEDLLEAAYRLARLLETPKHIPTLAPLIEQEILYRLLMSGQGVRLRHALVADSRAFKITRAVEWIKEHYDAPMRIDELASHVNMSVSSLHQHFKDATALSPLQYQKRLRLLEARRLLIKRASDVGVVASTVGYDNLSQFHREYKRLFGAPPIQDAVRLRTDPL
ncbi:AraC family transcriptional regulator [Paraburkholderia xenovorans]|uniref:AraC family transcriptional regulator n=1 Tax=Paraburkholderia xenovorans TaxID=36873 RepID=UPI001558A935|nr:AraC family transcriptional regulator [Paraburkholderia xenovorans]NPT38266.1 helix-turn-helix domain-containing protein [Paraburkholderia xenovorans]